MEKECQRAEACEKLKLSAAEQSSPNSFQSVRDVYGKCAAHRVGMRLRESASLRSNKTANIGWDRSPKIKNNPRHTPITIRHALPCFSNFLLGFFSCAGISERVFVDFQTMLCTVFRPRRCLSVRRRARPLPRATMRPALFLRPPSQR
jgi:hypothetical protein